MKGGKYSLIKISDGYTYQFYSEGPRGIIKKMIQFQPIKNLGINVFNIAFGDFNESTGKLDDLVVTNNNDRTKVLNTIVEAVVKFIEDRPNAIILAKGSTIARTRLYQMILSSFWLEIRQQYQVYGKSGKEWLPFERGVNYERFLIFKRIE